MSYRRMIAWMGDNDETGETDVEIVASLISTVMVADVFGKEPVDVAKAVLRYRRHEAKRRAELAAMSKRLGY